MIYRFTFDGKKHANGVFVLHTAHAAEVERLEAKAYEAKCLCYSYMAELEKMDAEVEDLVHRGATLSNVLAAERDAAVARAERAEEALRHTCKHLCQWKDACDTGCLVSAALAAAPDKPHYAALSPEPWGGPEGEE